MTQRVTARGLFVPIGNGATAVLRANWSRVRGSEQIHLENLAARSSRGEGTIQAILRGWRQRLAWGRASIPSLAEREQR